MDYDNDDNDNDIGNNIGNKMPSQMDVAPWCYKGGHPGKKSQNCGLFP